MNGASLVLYGLINVCMVLFYLFGEKGRLYEFPLWFGLICMGWFFPQALGGLRDIGHYPGQVYASGMFFASLCSLALWIGFHKGISAPFVKPTWLSARYDVDKLIKAGIIFSIVGFFFYWKLNSLPEEMLKQTKWSGATVKYRFFASLFKMGFGILWLIYLQQKKWLNLRLLIFLIPSLLLLLNTAFVAGRRAGMMDLFSYIFIGLWFCRRISIPRWALIGAVSVGLILINAIGMYRTIMGNENLTLGERLKVAISADYTAKDETVGSKAGAEFNNYMFFRQVVAEEKNYDWGMKHWNMLVFNYVPGQWVGHKLKYALMFKDDYSFISLGRERYGHHRDQGSGTTMTGYFDAFMSWSWLGWLKFTLLGLMMGALYRYAMSGFFLGKLLYIVSLGSGMHAVTHGTHQVLFSNWVYFFVLGFPLINWAKIPATGPVQT